MTLDLKVNDIPDVAGGKMIQLFGDLETESAIKFLKLIDKFMAENESLILIFDCIGVKTFSPQAVAAFAKINQKLKARLSGLILTRVTEPMIEIMDKLKVTNAFPIYQEVAKAVETLKLLNKKREEQKGKKEEEEESITETPTATRHETTTNIKSPTSTGMRRELQTDFTPPTKTPTSNVRYDVGQKITKEERTKIVEKTKKHQTSLSQYLSDDSAARFQPPAQPMKASAKYITAVIMAFPSVGGTFKQVENMIRDICDELFIACRSLIPLREKGNWDEVTMMIQQAEVVIVDFTNPGGNPEPDANVLTIASIARIYKRQNELLVLCSSKNVPGIWVNYPLQFYTPTSRGIKNMVTFFEKLLEVIPPTIPEEDE